MLTDEQYNKVDGIYPRRSLPNKEVDLMFNLFIEVFKWDAGCRTCPSTLTLVLDRLYPLIEEKRDDLKKKEFLYQQQKELKETEKLSLVKSPAKPVKKKTK